MSRIRIASAFPGVSGRGQVFIWLLLLGLSSLCGSAFAADADLQVSAYTWTPDPIINTGPAAFSLKVQNNGPAASTGSRLTINLADNVTYDADPHGCSYNGAGSPKTLTCSVGALSVDGSATLTYTAIGGPAAVNSSDASIVDDTPGNTDPNGGNDKGTKLITTLSGADLNFLSHTGPASANAGDNISFVLTVRNSGPDPVSDFRVTDNLPASVDFNSVSASGSSWSCSVNSGGPNVVCDYTGAALSSGASAPAIRVSGTLVTTAGTITNGASVASTDTQTGDPDQSNDTAPNFTVTVVEATDLRANKSMSSNALGPGSVFLSGEGVTLRLSASNTGLRDATGVTISDSVPGDFTLNAPLPAGCSATGQALTCTVGNLNAGQTSANFDVSLTAATVVSAATGSNLASVARTSPAAGNNSSATVDYTITPPFAHLELSKSKSGGPILAGANITNTIALSNSSSSTAAATGTVTVIDTLTDYPNEEFLSVAAPWACVNTTATDKNLTCSYSIPGAVAKGDSLPNLVITTRVPLNYSGGPLRNTARTGLGISNHLPADNGTSSDSASVIGTPNKADLSIAKTVSDTDVDTSENALVYTLTVTNNGGDSAGTVVVSDPIPIYYGGPLGTTTGSLTVSGGLGAGESCSGVGPTVSCTLKNLASGSPRTITITLNRPFVSGTTFNNTATISSPDTVETDSGNNSAAATVNTIAAITDLSITSIAAALDPVKAGVAEQFSVNIKNLGPNPAQGAEVEIPIDTALVTLVAGSIRLTGAGGSCSSGQPMNDPGWGGSPPAATGISCSGFTFSGNESRQIIYEVMPNHPYNGGVDGPYTAEARISTTSFESDNTNNNGSNTVTVSNALLDLAVTKHEATGYDPDGPGPLSNQLHDPVAFGDQIVYRVTLRNNGPSLATKVKLVDTITPPGGNTATFLSGSFSAAGSSYTPVNGVNCSESTGVVTCYLGSGGGDHADSILPANSSVAIQLTFGTGGSAPTGSLTYSNRAVVSSAETVAGLDSQTLNDDVTENTTVLPKTDLYLNKSVSKPVLDLNEPFTYTLRIGNEGASGASAVSVSDSLPGGFVMAGSVRVTPGAGVGLTTNACSAPAVGSGGSLSCSLGPIPADAARGAANQVEIAIPVRASYQSSGSYSFAFDTNIVNTGAISPLPKTSIDPIASNNNGTINVQVRKSSLSGVVFRDLDDDGLLESGENGVNGVLLSLTGKDVYGNDVTATATTAANGVYLFDNLPPSDGTGYTLNETQPADFFDGQESVAGAVIPGSKASDSIAGISVPSNTALSGYLFGELQQLGLAGSVWHDADNDGIIDGGESGIAGVTITLTGTDDLGAAVSHTTTTAANGIYNFGVLRPGTYDIAETQPGSHFDGKDTPGTLGGTLAADAFTGILLAPDAGGTGYNFGELLAATLSGAVFIDNNANAVQDAAETAGVTGLTMTLIGTDDLGNSVNLTDSTVANGAYSFSDLRPGVYSVTQTSNPGGLTHTGAQAGSKGGTIAGNPRAAGSGVTGETVKEISSITIDSDDNASGYNFGESGQGLTGFVYVDLNSNGTKETDEPGIPGVSITLSGNTASGSDICSAISPSPCTVTTDSVGAYTYTDLPASNAAGYALTEQSQSAPPLSGYNDGAESAGTLGGNIGNDLISGIPLVISQLGADYNFGELGGSISGVIYHDVDDNGAFDGSDTGIADVTITLSGTTASGADICTVLPTCTFTTAADGAYNLAGLPAGSYALSETQPVDFVSRTNSAGTSGGTVAADIISGITLGVGDSASGYLFGEKTGGIEGFVYNDANNDGVKDGSEGGIEGVTITLSGTTAAGVDLCATIASCTTTTAADGSYSFTGLRNANAAGYTLSESQPAGYMDGKEAQGKIDGANCGVCDNSSDNLISGIPFNLAGTYTGFDFGDLLGAAISGLVWHDISDDGNRDTGEPGLGLVTLDLSGTDDLGNPVNLSIQSAADGTYSFTGLRPSDTAGYTVTETQPTGIDDFPAASGTQVGTVGGNPVGSAALNEITAIVVGSADQGIDYDFREDAALFVNGFVYLDANDDGVRDAAEAGIAGVTINLEASGGAACADGTPACSAVTDANGKYLFAGLRAGAYTLTEVHPVQYQDARETAGTLGGTVDNSSFSADPAQNRIADISLSAGAEGSAYNFGELLGAMLSGAVFIDNNANAMQDAGETAGVTGLTMTLSGVDDLGNSVNLTATTGADGAYRFDNLRPGTYSIAQTSDPDGLTHTGAQAGSKGGAIAGSHRAAGTGATGETLTLISNIIIDTGDTATGYNFGESGQGLTGYVYVDQNNNGTRETDEPGIPGVSIILSGNTENGTDVCVAINPCTVATNSAGAYTFADLPASDASGYILTEQSQSNPPLSGYSDGAESAGTLGGSVGNDQISGILLGINQLGTDYNFGELFGTALSGLVWHDIDEDGNRDAGEPGLGLVTLVLSGKDEQGNSVNRTTRSAADGQYSFAGLRPSDAAGYTVTETQPAGINDFPAASGTRVGTVGGNPVGSAALNRITGIILGSSDQGIDYDFSEDAAIFVNGLVYLDADDDGVRDAVERGIEGITINLAASGGGACADGTTACSAVTDANGAYLFAGLRAGDYRLTEAHPVIYEDARETAGSLGGTVDNSSFSADPAQNRIASITLPAGSEGSAYLFGELPGLRARVAGQVWINSNPAGTRERFDTGDTPLSGWIVEVVKDDAVLASTTTGSDGGYEINTVTPDYDYSVRFRNPANGLVWGFPVANGGVGRMNEYTGTIDGITVPSNGTITGLDLPIDPAGIVYDATSRTPLAGATVTLSGPAGLDPAIHVIGGSATQSTGADGLYQFFLTPAAPSGTYTLTVNGPAGYLPGVSALIPSCATTLTLAATPNPARVHSSVNPPPASAALHDPGACPADTGAGGFVTGSATTLYYLSFAITVPTSGNLIQNHIPLDPMVEGAIVATKSTPKVNVIRGELIPYRLTFTNTLEASLPNIDLKDQLPAGFKYRSGTARLNDVDTAPVAAGRALTWADQTFAPNETKTIKLMLAAGAGVSEGEYVNQTWAENNRVSARVSNIATATVRLVPDPLFDCSELIGKVFDDRNANGYQDEGEAGIPNVRLATVRGLLITTDEHGRYHVTCAAVPNELRGSNFIIKLDERSLPSGYRITSENPRVVRLTRGKMTKANFGAAIHRVIGLDVTVRAFNKETFSDDWVEEIEQLITLLKQSPSVLRLTYWRSSDEPPDEARERLDNLEAQIRTRWEQEDCCYDLLIEKELTSGGAK